VFIDAAFPEPTFKVYQLFCISGSGNAKRQFFIDYDLKETNTTSFSTCQVSFDALNSGLQYGTTLADEELTSNFFILRNKLLKKDW
jgi:hypothetical protein